jgi:hypothetical protein
MPLWERTLCATAFRAGTHGSSCRRTKFPALSLLVSRALARRRPKGVPAGWRPSGPLPRPGSLSLACPRESNQRERHPAWRCPGLRPSQSVRGGRAFRPGSCPGEKCPTSMSGTPAGPDRPPLTATQGMFEGSCRCAAHRLTKLQCSVWHVVGAHPVRDRGPTGHLSQRLSRRPSAQARPPSARNALVGAHPVRDRGLTIQPQSTVVATTQRLGAPPPQRTVPL